jgi:hypothetical protein
MASENQTGVASGFRPYVFLFLLFLFALTYIHQKRFDAPTPVSRLNLMHALMHGTFRIDAYHRNTPDKAVLDGHYYSDKAPGTVTLAFPAFAATAVLLELGGVSLDSELGWLATSWVASAASNGLPAALGGLALFAWLSRRVEPRWAFVTTLAIFLGAAPLPYATMMFSHALVVGLLAVAIWAIAKTASSPRPSPPSDGGEGDGQTEKVRQSSQVSECAGAGARDFRFRYDALAGFACGLALASEYTAGIIVVALFLWLISHGWRRGA